MTTIYDPNAPKMDPARRAELQAKQEARGFKKITAPPLRAPRTGRQDLSGVRDDGTLVGRGGNTQQLGAAAQRRLAREQPQPKLAVSQPIQPSPGLRGFAPAGVTTATATRQPTTASVTTEPSDIQARMVQLAEERGLPPPAGAGDMPGSSTPPLADAIRTATMRGAVGTQGPTDMPVARPMPSPTPYMAGIPAPNQAALRGALSGFAPGAMPPPGGARPPMETADGGSPFDGLAQVAALQRRRPLGGGAAGGGEVRAY